MVMDANPGSLVEFGVKEAQRYGIPGQETQNLSGCGKKLRQEQL